MRQFINLKNKQQERCQFIDAFFSPQFSDD
jgi:hypothetical protein